MKTHRFALAATLLVAGALSASAQEVKYDIDPVHSVAIAKALHGGVSHGYARFNGVSGSVTFNEADPSKSSVSVEIKADSIDTANEKRDQHLKSPDFLNAKEFPMITFKSTKVVKTGDKAYEVTGDLTVRGVTKPLTTTFNVVGMVKKPNGDLSAGGEVTFKVKRSDFGSNFNPQALSDEIEIMVSFEGGKKA